jgi:leucyl/phenylalanyl-tRNA--protein transferase
LIAAYCRGIFPMADPDTGRVDWFSPDPRGVIPLEAFHVPRSLARIVRQKRFELRTDTQFEDVMRRCAEPRTGHEGTWIDQRLLEAYVGLHELGHAHSVEAWVDDELVGGLYGVHLGAAFFGESMFVRADCGGRDASKVCLVALVDLLRSRGFGLLDTQFWNAHIGQFGCTEVPREQYLKDLAQALAREASWPEPGRIAPCR